MQESKITHRVAFSNQKGGVLKTTLTAQVAYGLAKFHNKKVLAIDLDPQGNLTMALRGMSFEMGGSSFEVLKRQRLDLVYPVGETGIYLLPSDISLAEAEMGLSGRGDWQYLLKAAIENEENGTNLSEFDYILIDTPPNLNLLTLNALVAADEVVIPLSCDGFALSGVAGLKRTIKTMQRLNPGLIIGGVVACRHDARRVIDREMVLKMQEIFGDLVFNNKIPESTALKECGAMGKSIWEYGPNSLAAPTMEKIVAEFLERIGTHVQAE